MSSDREYTLDLLVRAYRILLAFGMETSSNPEHVLLMDEIKLELEFHGAASTTGEAP